MKGRRRYLYGSLGLLSLLGFVGVLTQERVFLLFFAFAVDFGHWFRKNDEMVEDYMNRSAALAFYVGMAATGILGTGAVFLQGMDGHRALLTGLAGGFAVARLGAEVHDPVGAFDDLHVVLHDHDRVPPFDQGVERRQQFRYVVEVESRRRLVEDEQDAAVGGLLREERGELHALALAAREGRGGAPLYDARLRR